MDCRFSALSLVGFLLGASALPACTEAPNVEPPTQAETWIEADVELNAAGDSVHLIAFATDGSLRAASVDASTTGQHRLGPLPPGSYDIAVFPTAKRASAVHNYPAVSVTTELGAAVGARLAQPGEGSVDVRFGDSRRPGTLVVAVTLFDGVQQVVTHGDYVALYRADASERRARNTISDDSPDTHFEGLAAGSYTACAKVNLGGDNLKVACDVVEVAAAEHAELALDLSAVAGLEST